MFGVVFKSVSCTFASHRERLAVAKARTERGFILVFTSIAIVVLTAIAGFAVDLGNWYWHTDRLQKSVDAAALAGAPYLPGSPDKAYAAATDVLEQNGFKAEDIAIDSPAVDGNDNQYTAQASMVQDPDHPSRLKIEAGVKVHNVLVNLIGVNDPWLVRSATATYRQAVVMGSPGNVLGAEPLQPGQLTVQNRDGARQGASHNSSYWLNIAGTNSDKISGDRYTAGTCSSGVDGCSTTDKNTEVTKVNGLNSHQYIVHIPASLDGQTFTLQAFDASYIDVGDHCDSSGTYASQLGTSALNSYVTGTLHQDASAYAAGAGDFCTGDYNQGTAGAGKPGTAPTLKFTVQKSNGYDVAVGSPVAPVKTFPGYQFSSSTSLLQHLQSDPKLRESFRRWADVATIRDAGDYVVTVSTPVGAGGANRFSLRLGVGASTHDGNGFWDTSSVANKVSVYAKQALAVYTNATDADTSFYFAKLTDSAAGRSLTIELYDIGDVPAGETVDLQLLAPRCSRVECEVSPDKVGGGAGGGGGLSNFKGCSAQNPITGLFETITNCQIKNASSASGYNGRVIKMNVQVPDNYSCTDVGGTGCWMSLRFNLHGASGVSATNPSTDTTTWQIDDCGNPVKLIKGDAPDDDCPAVG